MGFHPKQSTYKKEKKAKEHKADPKEDGDNIKDTSQQHEVTMLRLLEEQELELCMSLDTQSGQRGSKECSNRFRNLG